MTKRPRFWKNRNVLITGASGFIGSSLTKTLIESGANVITLTTKEIKNHHIIQKKHLKKIVAQINDSIENFKLLNKILKKYKIGIVFHLAAQPLVEIGKKSPLSTFETNIKGTWNVLEAARKNKVKKIIVASTTHVYGDNPNVPFKEEYFPQPSRPYETSKACADLLAQSFADSFNLPVEIPRFSNIYGPGDVNFSRLVPRVLDSIYNKKRLEIWDTGAVRDFLYLDDALEAYLILAERELPKVKRHRVFNIGSGQPTDIKDLVKALVKLTEIAKRISYQKSPSERKNEISKQFISIDKAKDILGWKPKHKLDRGLQKTINWYASYFTK